MSTPLTSASAFRQVDQLTGRVAELERDNHKLEEECDQWCAKCADALTEIESLKRERTELFRFVDLLRAQRDGARDALATCNALRSVTP